MKEAAWGHSEHDIRTLCPGAEILPGLAIRGGSVTGADGELPRRLHRLNLCWVRFSPQKKEDIMIALAICGSPRKNGNTATLLRAALEPLRQSGWETELFELAGKNITGCRSCGTCIRKRNGECAIKNDLLHEELFPRMLKADAILIGSPTYFAGITPELKAVIDRAGFVALANGGAFAGKIGAAVVAERRGGAIHVYDTINHFFLISEMLVPGSTYWNLGFGTIPGEVAHDREAMENMNHLGRTIAWLGNAVSSCTLPFPGSGKKISRPDARED